MNDNGPAFRSIRRSELHRKPISCLNPSRSVHRGMVPHFAIRQYRTDKVFINRRITLELFATLRGEVFHALRQYGIEEHGGVSQEICGPQHREEIRLLIKDAACLEIETQATSGSLLENEMRMLLMDVLERFV